ncbi:MAG: hypothetical protein OHK0024_24560 [Thalassobaculales bacterium]
MLIRVTATAGLLAAGLWAGGLAAAEGRFSGTLSYVGNCDAEAPPPFSGTVANGRISGRAARGRPFDWPVAADGSFGGEMELRQHARGMKIQRYRGRVVDGHVEVEVYFGVPGQPRTECTARSRLPLQ